MELSATYPTSWQIQQEMRQVAQLRGQKMRENCQVYPAPPSVAYRPSLSSKDDCMYYVSWSSKKRFCAVVGNKLPGDIS